MSHLNAISVLHITNQKSCMLNRLQKMLHCTVQTAPKPVSTFLLLGYTDVPLRASDVIF